MKAGIVVTIMALLVANSRAAEVSYKLSEAVQKKLVNVKMNGAKSDTSGLYVSSHVGPCMAMEIANTSTDDLLLNLEYGYKLEPADSSIQTMMVTQTLMVKLAPKQKKNYRIYAMCTEAHDGSPSEKQTFNLGKRFSGNILSLAELISRKRYQTDAAQKALWCLTDGYELSSIYSDDTTQMYDLRRFVAKVKGISLTDIYKGNNGSSYSEPQRVVRTRTVYSGSLSYSVSRTAKVLIALFDENNRMKKVYVNNEMQREGQYTYDYNLSSDEMENKKHYLRMFRDGRLEEEIAILPRE
ncbi:MAG: hypothetical protein KIS94_01830 [Chitinophagales bacterium]|nr:hypothetical protein [Chitinophagales bacterium]